MLTVFACAMAVLTGASTVDLNQKQGDSEVKKFLAPIVPAPTGPQGQPLHQAPQAAPSAAPQQLRMIKHTPDYIFVGGVGMKVLGWSDGGLLDNVYTVSFKGAVQGPVGFYTGLDLGVGGFTGDFSQYELENPAYVDFGMFVGWSPIQLALGPVVPYLEVGAGGQFFVTERTCYLVNSDLVCNNHERESYAQVRGTSGLQFRLLPYAANNGGLYLDVSGTVGSSFTADRDDRFGMGRESLFWGVQAALVGKISIF